MGNFTVSIQVQAKEDGLSEQLEALVDTGATYTVLPKAVVERLGLVSQESREFVLADGRRTSLEVGEALITLEGRSHHSVCIFGEEGSEPLLGAVTLEEFGLGIDPVNQKLMPVAGYLVSLRPYL